MVIYNYFKIMLQIFGDFVFFFTNGEFCYSCDQRSASIDLPWKPLGTSEIILAASASPSDRMTSGDQLWIPMLGTSHT